MDKLDVNGIQYDALWCTFGRRGFGRRHRVPARKVAYESLSSDTCLLIEFHSNTILELHAPSARQTSQL